MYKPYISQEIYTWYSISVSIYIYGTNPYSLVTNECKYKSKLWNKKKIYISDQPKSETDDMISM